MCTNGNIQVNILTNDGAEYQKVPNVSRAVDNCRRSSHVRQCERSEKLTSSVVVLNIRQMQERSDRSVFEY